MSLSVLAASSFSSAVMESTPRRYAIVRANRLLVDLCGFLVCHVVSDLGNSGRLLSYARRRHSPRRIRNLARL